MSELAKCPFCGKNAAEIVTVAELENCVHFEDEKRCPKFKYLVTPRDCKGKCVVCNFLRGGCGVTTRYFWGDDADEKAAEAWNRRASGGDG